MTVAAFLAVAAYSYAAVPAKSAGNEVTIAKGKSSASIEVALKKGDYAITSDEGEVTLTAVGDNAVYPDAGAVVIPDKGATVKITVTLAAAAEKDTKALVKIEPTGKDWVTKKQAIQNEINQIVTEATALPDDPTNVNYAKRTSLIDRASQLQKKVNEMGIEEYNEFLDNDGTIPSIEGGVNGLNSIKGGVKAATANQKAYENALAEYNAIKNGDLKDLEDAYAGIKDKSDVEQSTKDAAKALVEQNKKNVEQFKTDLDKAYSEGTAAALFSEEKVAEKIGKKDSAADKNDGTGLLGDIEDAQKSIDSGSAEDMAYNNVKSAVNGSIAFYNMIADALYELLEAESIPEGYGKDIYDDIYKKAIDDMKPYLTAILAVGDENEAAHKEGKAKDISDKLNDPFGKIAAVYVTTREQVGARPDQGEPAAKSFRGIYKAAQDQLDAFTASLEDYKEAAADKDVDKDKKEIAAYFTGKVNTLKGQIKDIQDKLDAANKAHFKDKGGEVIPFDVAALADADKGYTATKAAADADLAEYNAYKGSRETIDAAEKELTDPKTGAKAEVAKMKSEDGKFVATDHFSTAKIEKAISDLRDNNRKNYSVTATDKKIAEAYAPTVTTEAGKISGDINTYKTTAQNAFDNYTVIAEAIADFTASIEGKQEVDKDGKPVVDKDKKPVWVIGYEPWAEVVTNEDVTLNGNVPGTSYGEAKATEEDVCDAAQKAVDDALAIAKDKEKDFSDAMATAAGNAGDVNDARNQIIYYKNQYAGDVDPWEKNTAAKAKEDAIKESTARTQALIDRIDLINQAKPKEGEAKPDKVFDDYATDDYGTAAAGELNTSKQELLDALNKDDGKSVTALINEAEATGDESVAIAQIKNQVQPKLDDIEGKINTLESRATAAKAAYGDFTRAADEVDELINGVQAKDKNGDPAYDEKGNPIWEKKPITELLKPADTDFLKDEIAEQQGLLNDDINADLEASKDVAAARKDSKDKDGKTVKGLDNRLADVKTAVEDLVQKAKNESANQTAWNTWNDKLNKYETVDKKDKSVQNIIDETEAAIYKSQPGETGKDAKDRDLPSDGEQFFLDQLNELKDELQDLKEEAEEQFNQKIKDDKKNDTKYTDPKFNLANGDLEDYYLDELATIVDDMKGLVALSAANEVAYEDEKKAYEEAKTAYEELLVEVNKAKETGENYEAAYEAAMTKLTDINTELKRYKNGYDTKDKNGKDKHVNGYDEAYANGESVEFDGDLAVINGIKTELKNLKDTWNAGEDEEGSYKKAVADDNAARKTAFDNAFTKLYKGYYGEMKGSTKVDGAVDVVTKLSKTHFADQVTDAVKEIVTGTSDKCLYTYAEKITKLQKDAQAAYDAVTAPDVFDEAETWKAKAEAMEATISGLAQDYANAVNNQAWEDYQDHKNILTASLEQAVDAIGSALDVNEDAALKLANAAPEGQKGAKDILDNAMVQAGEKPNADKKTERAIDFAYQLEKKILPEMEYATEQLLPSAMVKAATDNWATTFGKVDTAKEEAAIAGFYGAGFMSDDVEDYEQGFYSYDYQNDDDEDFEDQVDRLNELEERWTAVLTDYLSDDDDIVYAKAAIVWTPEVWRACALLDEYEEIKEDLDEEVQTRNLGDDKKPNYQTHSSVYWTAYDEDQNYQQLLKGNAALAAVQATLTEELQDAFKYYADLLVEHDEELAATAESIAVAIEDLTPAEATADKQPAVKAIEARIDDLKERAILKEYEALGVEIGEIDKAFGDKDAALRKTLNTYKKTNDGIYGDHVDGKKNEKGEYILDENKKKIYADQDEVKERFAALEKYVGKTKGEVDEAAKTAAADVAAAVVALDGQYEALQEELSETNEYVQEYYEEEVERAGELVNFIKNKIEKEGDAITIEKDNNLEAIEKAVEIMGDISQRIAADQEPFDKHEEVVATLTNKLTALTARLDLVNEVAAGYEHQILAPEDEDGWYRFDEEGEKVYYTNFREFMYDNLTAAIAETQAAVDELPVRSYLDPAYDYDEFEDMVDHLKMAIGYEDEDGEWTVGGLERGINHLEKGLAAYDAGQYVEEAEDYLDEVHDKLWTIIGSMENLDVDTEKWEALDDLTCGDGGLYDRLGYVRTYGKNVLVDGESAVGIDGEYLNEDEEAEEIDFVTEAYPEILATVAEIRQATVFIEAQLVTPGAVTNGETVIGSDIAAISNLILGITDPEDLTEAQRSAADVDGDEEYTVADLTMAQNMYVYGSYEGYVPTELTVKAKARENAKPVYYGNGSLSMDIATSQIDVNLEKGKSYAAIQMDVTLPAGVELADAAFAGDNEAASVAFNKIGGNTWRVLISANDNSSVNADEALVSLSIAGEGAGKVAIDNAIAATAKGKSVKLAGISGDFTIATGIAATDTKVEEGESTIFGANGAIRKQLEKGVNIIKTAGGAVKKIFVK